MSVRLERKKFNKKVKHLNNVASRKYTTGIFDPENARKGILLDEGIPGQQVARPWFSGNMNGSNKAFRYLIKNHVQALIRRQITERLFVKHLTEYCRESLDDPDLDPLTERTIQIKSGEVPRPDTGRKRKSAGNPEDIGRDSLKMYRSIKTTVTKR
jgi:hypothetical protein